LFQPFSQAEASTARRYGGSGLGLAISQRFAELMGGQIEVVSEPGRGSTFALIVPAELAAAAPPEESAGRDLTATAASPSSIKLDGRVLLAEDCPDSQRLICFILRKAGADVTLAENGQSAVELALAAEAQGRPYGLILMDMQMPVLDGYAATRLLRCHGYDGPIVALTAHAMSGDRQQCLAAGCTDYLAKPLDRHRLLSLASRYTGRGIQEHAAIGPSLNA
jgi:CheY-like chemotaxis protein